MMKLRPYPPSPEETSIYPWMWFAFQVRLIVLVLMMTADAWIPDHNPGDDVLRFDLRLSPGSDCYCLQGHYCDDAWKDYNRMEERQCVQKSTRSIPYVRDAYKLLLSPFTKWDAARFLTLATDAHVRYPPDSCTDNEGECNDQEHRLQIDAEQAHAFFPGLPSLLIWLRAFMSYATGWLPLINQLLPPTFEAQMTLMALLLNWVLSILTVIPLSCLTRRQFSNNDIHHFTLLLFVVHPATVFFATAYSESIFFFLTTSGYYAYTLGQERDSDMYLLAGSFCWTCAAAIRYNGLLVVGFFILELLPKLWALLVERTTTKHAQTLVVATILVTVPLYLHEYTARNLHCSQAPTACSGSFYRHVQNKHWNVGLLRYYTWNQIPNFLLASPILVLSFKGVLEWIHSSSLVFRNAFPHQRQPNVRNFLHWVLAAVLASPHDKPQPSVVLNTTLLSHFAVLCAAALLGLLVAHVQISTRLILSTCPAIYWYLAEQMVEHAVWRKLIFIWSFSYMVVGIVMHVNFLPWT